MTRYVTAVRYGSDTLLVALDLLTSRAASPDSTEVPRLVKANKATILLSSMEYASIALCYCESKALRYTSEELASCILIE